jgi:hypothetical protein
MGLRQALKRIQETLKLEKHVEKIVLFFLIYRES